MPMDYFLITQDGRIGNRVEPLLSKTGLDGKPQGKSALMLLEVREKQPVEYVDFVERPFRLVSDRLKQWLKIVEPTTAFEPVVLNDPKNGRQSLYWRFDPPILPGLSSETELHKDGRIKRLVLDQGQVAGWRIFQLAVGKEALLVFDLLVVEGMLRREFTGFKLTRVDPGTETGDQSEPALRLSNGGG